MRLGNRPLVWGAMMDEIRCAIEYREDETRQSPGRIVGTLLTYGKRARDRAEVFEAGALHWPEGGIILNEQHNRQAPIMRFTPELAGDELRIDAPLPDTQRGRDAATMVRNGTFTGLSIEFRAEAEGRASGVRMIRKGFLGGAAAGGLGLACHVGRGPGQDARPPGAPMPVTLTQVELSGALRLGDSTEEDAEAARLLSFATVAVARHLGDAFDDAPDAVVNEGVIPAGRLPL